MMTGLDITNFNFALMKKKSEVNRVLQAQDFRALYENDYEEKVRVIKKYFKDKPFSEETLSRMFFQSIDTIQKTLNRKTAGILDGLVIKIEGVEEDENLKRVIDQIDLISRIHESLKRSEYFTTVIAQPIWRDRIDVDLITGDECTVQPKDDYLEIDTIKLGRADASGLLYYVVWSRDEHYEQDGNGNDRKVEGNDKGVNPYRAELDKINRDLQFCVLRKKEGLDFWGEPNWNLFLNQLSSDMKLTDNERGEFFQKWAILLGVNTNKPDNFRIDPGTFVQINNADREQQISLDYVSPDIDWASIRDNHEAKQKQVLVSEGLPASSSSTETTDLSGSAKLIDEVELNEYRESTKRKLRKFVKDLLNCIRVVHNYHCAEGDKIPDGEFVIDYKPVRTFESNADKWLRRKYEYQFGLSTPIDWIMEDKDLTRDAAKEYLKQVQMDKSDIGFTNTDLFNNLNKLNNANA